MFRLWAKIWKDNHLVKDLVIENDDIELNVSLPTDVKISDPVKAYLKEIGKVSLLSKEGYISPRAVHQKDAFDAGIKFARCEGIVPAPETTHAIKATIDEALKCKETGEEKTIVMNFSGHGMLDLKGYASYFEGTLQNAK